MAQTTIGGMIESTAVVPNLDFKYGPYSSVSDAYEALGPNGLDKITIGLTVGIINNGTIKEYWFKDGITLDKLVEKISWNTIDNKPEGVVIDSGYVHTDNNFTNTDKTKLSNIESGAQANVIDSVKVNDVALEVTNKAVNIDLTGKEDISNKVTVITNDSTDIQYPSAKCVYDNTRKIIPITILNLINLKSNSQLIPGMKYEIVYECSVYDLEQASLIAQNKYTATTHKFNLILEALNNNTLSTHASAIYNSDDTYFQNSELEKWKIEYTLGVGITKMTDEFNITLPFDFKNIKLIDTLSNTETYLFDDGSGNDLSIGGTLNSITYISGELYNSSVIDDIFDLSLQNQLESNIVIGYYLGVLKSGNIFDINNSQQL